MKKENIEIAVKLIITVIVIYFAYNIVSKLLQGFGLVDTKAEIATDKKVTENVKAVEADLEKIKTDIKKSTTLTDAQKKLIQPTYSDSKYKEMAQKLYEAFNHVGTSSGIVKDTFSLLKNRTDVLSLIAAYGVRQTYVLGLPDGKPADLISHLVSENEIGNANKGLEVNKVYYNF